MRVEVREEPPTSLEEYEGVPIAFEVRSVLDVAGRPDAPGRFVLTERPLDTPYRKDYDAADGGGPSLWPESFDLSTWGLFAARAGGRRVGGAAVAFGDRRVEMLEGREDLAVLWDIRVSPEWRGLGVGARLFRAAEDWARARGCRQLKVETQNVNVPACRFYERRGCVLAVVDRTAYPSLPGEIQLLWYKAL